MARTRLNRCPCFIQRACAAPVNGGVRHELIAMTFMIRHATAKDIPALAALHVQTFNETHLRGGGSGLRVARASME